MVAHQMTFQIHGDFLTTTARNRVLDDNPGSAWRILTSCDGEGIADAAVAILSGHKRFEGINDLVLVDDDTDEAKAYRERLAWLYAGRKKINTQWYRPVARVVDFGIRDLRNDHGMPVNPWAPGMGYRNRQWHYAYFGREIAPECTNDDVIFEICGERPHWMNEPRTIDDAIEEFLKVGRGLERRGHSIWYPGNDGIDLEVHQYPHGNNGRKARNDTDFVGASWDRPPPGREHSKHVDRVMTACDALDEISEEMDLEEAEEKQREEDRKKFVAELRAKILAQAGTDLVELRWNAEELTEQEIAWGKIPHPAGTKMVPRAPFLHWAFDRQKRFKDLLPPWKTISPGSMKQTLDNPNHTDWIIGAGLDPIDDRQLYMWGPLMKAAMELASKYQDEFYDLQKENVVEVHNPEDVHTDVHVLSPGPIATGVVHHGVKSKPCPKGAVVVLPDLHPKYVETVKDAVAIVTETGGGTAHLVQVGREQFLPIMRLPNALALFNEGDLIIVNTDARTITEL